MYSRILVGAHFLTDVTFGAIITLVSFKLAKFLTDKLMMKIKVDDLVERSKPCLIEETIE
jgi:membrane-associated phospholipid phosphatase